MDQRAKDIGKRRAARPPIFIPFNQYCLPENTPLRGHPTGNQLKPLAEDAVAAPAGVREARFVHTRGARWRREDRPRARRRIRTA
jgi:hypothetical protein